MALAREIDVQCTVDSSQRLEKWYLIPLCLTRKVCIKSKVEQSRCRASPTPQCRSYSKGSLRVALDYGRQLYLNRLIGLVGRVFTNGPGDLGSVPGRVIPKTFKMVLDTSLLNTQQYKERIKGKVEQSRERSITLQLGVVAMKREPSGRTRLRSPTLLHIYIYIYIWFIFSDFTPGHFLQMPFSFHFSFSIFLFCFLVGFLFFCFFGNS